MRFAPRHVVTMVVSVCGAAVLAPIGVRAATGQLVNIADPFNAAQTARVSARGTLWVESRAGVAPDSFHYSQETVTDVITHPLHEVTAPLRIAVTQATFTLHGDNSASTNHVRLYARVRTSGSQPCSNGTGWSSPQTLATVVVRAGSTEQLLFNGPPLVLPAAATGQRLCLGFQQTKWTGSTDLDVNVTGYAFR